MSDAAKVKTPKNVFEREETVEGWDFDYYHPISEVYYDKAVAGMLEALGAKPGDTVLDAGCGPGVHSIRAAKLGVKVRSIDLSERMLSHARERATKAGVSDRIEFSQDDLTKLSLATGAFPYVFSWGVVIHIPEAEKALDNLARVTAPGGRLALHVANARSLDFSLERGLRSLIRKPLKDLKETPLGLGVWYAYNDDRLWVQRFDTQKLAAAMATRGMRLVSVRTAEFTEFQRRVPRPLRPLVFWFNRIAYALKLPASLACTHILVFEKQSAAASR